MLDFQNGDALECEDHPESDSLIVNGGKRHSHSHRYAIMYLRYDHDHEHVMI
jgi:hypothetical protein